MDASSRIVFGYHGTTPEFSERLIRGEVVPADWKPSTNVFDWLGAGIYFWEFAPERARTWAKKGGVVGAIIKLGRCLDLSEIRSTELLADAFGPFAREQARQKQPLPRNKGKRRELDCAVIDFAAKQIRKKTGQAVQTVRGAFLEGGPIFPGSSLLKETHIQIAVRDISCIIGLFRPT